MGPGFPCGVYEGEVMFPLKKLAGEKLLVFRNLGIHDPWSLGHAMRTSSYNYPFKIIFTLYSSHFLYIISLFSCLCCVEVPCLALTVNLTQT